MDYPFPPGSTQSLTLSQVFAFSTSDATNCALTTIKTFNIDGTTEEASAPYATAQFTVDGSDQVTTTKKIRAYDSSGSNYVEGTLNIHMCGAEELRSLVYIMFVT